MQEKFDRTGCKFAKCYDWRGVYWEIPIGASAFLGGGRYPEDEMLEQFM